MIQQTTLLNVGIFALFGMASTCVLVAWFGATQLPQRECAAAEIAQKQMLEEQFAQELRTNSLRPHAPIPFCYDPGKQMTPAEFYGDIGQAITEKPGAALFIFVTVSSFLGGIVYGLWSVTKGVIWAFHWLRNRDSGVAHAQSAKKENYHGHQYQ